MNWEAIGAVGETVGAIATVATLAYLAFQIRHNTRQLEQNERASKATAVTASTTGLREVRKAVFENPELTELWMTGLNQPSELGERDAYRFRIVMQNCVEAIRDFHSQTAASGFSPETWQTEGIALVERIILSPGGRQHWAEFKHTYPDDFRSEVESVMSGRSSNTANASTPAAQQDVGREE